MSCRIFWSACSFNVGWNSESGFLGLRGHIHAYFLYPNPTKPFAQKELFLENMAFRRMRLA